MNHEPGQTQAVLELDVNNHAGVMSHIVGLFPRRAYNVEGILCMPVGNGATSRIWLTVNEDARLEQMTRQLEKLEDVLNVRGTERNIRSSSAWGNSSGSPKEQRPGVRFGFRPGALFGCVQSRSMKVVAR